MLGDSMIGFLRALEGTVTVTYRMTVGDPSSSTGRHDLFVRPAPSGLEMPPPLRIGGQSVRCQIYMRNLPTVLRLALRRITLEHSMITTDFTGNPPYSIRSYSSPG